MRKLLLASTLVPLCTVLGVAPAARAGQLQGSPDVAIDAAGPLSADEVNSDLQTGPPAAIDLGPLPDGAQVTSYSTFGGVALFSVAHTLSLPGGVTARPRDLVGWDGSFYNIVLDGGSFGFPDGAAIDAFWADPGTGALLLSFDTTVDLSGTVVRDADVVDAALTVVFDSAAVGLPAGVDVDGVSGIPNRDVLLLSFDVGGSIGGVTFADEDVLAYHPAGGGSWALYLDASQVDVAWERADLDALHQVPEPAAALLLTAGALLLAGAARRRYRPLLAVLGLLGLGAAPPAGAGGGALAIDQSCATLTGCFGGDAPGFPVTISKAGLYELTSNLAGTDPVLHAIEVTADDVTIDLRGFEVAGPAVCSGSGSALSCSFAGNTGRGIEAGGALRAQVRDGVVRGFPGGGVVLGDDGAAYELTVEGNGSDGVTTGDRARIEGAIAFANAGKGIAVGTHSIVQRSVARENADAGISTGIAGVLSRDTSAANGDDGISVGGGSVVRLAAAHDNEQDGLSVGSGSRVSECAVSFNDRVGIRAVLVAAIQHSAVFENGGGQPDDYGLHLTLGASSYRESVVDQNGVGAGTVLGGIDMGANVCDGAVGCP